MNWKREQIQNGELIWLFHICVCLHGDLPIKGHFPSGQKISSGESYTAWCPPSALCYRLMLMLCQCLYCSECETVFHTFCHCSTLTPLMELLSRLLTVMGIKFTKTVFNFGCKYYKSWKDKCCLAIFFIGQAKWSVWKTQTAARRSGSYHTPA